MYYVRGAVLEFRGAEWASRPVISPPWAPRKRKPAPARGAARGRGPFAPPAGPSDYTFPLDGPRACFILPVSVPTPADVSQVLGPDRRASRRRQHPRGSFCVPRRALDARRCQSGRLAVAQTGGRRYADNTRRAHFVMLHLVVRPTPAGVPDRGRWPRSTDLETLTTPAVAFLVLLCCISCARRNPDCRA